MGFNDRMQDVDSAYTLTIVDKKICSNCIVDDYLSDFIKVNASSKSCSYCLITDVNNIACDYKIIAQMIYDSIFLSYKDAQDTGMPYVEGGWLFDEVYIEDLIADFDPGWNEEFGQDIINSADPNLYLVPHVLNDWAGIPSSEVLGYGWEEFKDQILYKTRYLFLTQKSSHNDFYSIPLVAMLDRLGDLCKRLNLIKVVEKDCTFYRVRSHAENEGFTQFAEIGAAPRGKAGAGRMNPVGISYFYIAFSQKTAELEVISDQFFWSLAKIKLLNNISVLNLSDLPPLPSIFDKENHDLREEILFLHQFVEDLLKPVSRDGSEHIEYVPTQVVSEYFRYVFEPKLQGIMYPSVKDVDGLNIAIFESDNDQIQKMFNLEEIVECQK